MSTERNIRTLERLLGHFEMKQKEAFAAHGDVGKTSFMGVDMGYVDELAALQDAIRVLKGEQPMEQQLTGVGEAMREQIEKGSDPTK